MQRAMIYDTDGRVLGWFDQEAAGRWDDRDPKTGNGGHGTGRGEAVLLTAGGKWVREQWSSWDGERSIYAYITEDDARDWLLGHGFEKAVAEHIGPQPDEIDRRSLDDGAGPERTD